MAQIKKLSVLTSSAKDFLNVTIIVVFKTKVKFFIILFVSLKLEFEQWQKKKTLPRLRAKDVCSHYD